MKLLTDIIGTETQFESERIIGVFETTVETPSPMFTQSIKFVRPHDERKKALRDQFRRLADQWHRETDGYSAIQKKISHPAHLRILAMGQDALPLILEELAVRPGHWFVALSSLTEDHENPVPVDHAGDMQLVINDWIEYGKRKRILP